MRSHETYRKHAERHPQYKDAIFASLACVIADFGTIEDLKKLKSEYEKEESTDGEKPTAV